MAASRFHRILVVDDEENIRHMLEVVLRKQGWDVSSAGNAEEALEALAREPYDLMLSDIRMPGKPGLELLQEVRRRHPDLVVLMMSAYGNLETTIEAIKLGAYDYIAKPFKPIEAVVAIRKAEERERLKWENRQLKSDLEQMKSCGFGKIVTRNDEMQRILRTVGKIAGHKTTVLIQGESGTGKELVARAVHDLSTRQQQPFVAVNCGAIPETLLESELFGHRRGAFTDAKQDKKGLFAEADAGTLFLDEVGELPQSLQVKLLRVLQEEQFRRVGDSQPTKVDVRVVAATVRDLRADAKIGRFREDLLYRLNVMTLQLPPLRERPEDVPALIEHALLRHNERLGLDVKRVSAATMKLLMEHDWPGNVRELENTVEHAMVLTEGSTVHVENLPGHIKQLASPVRRILRGDSLSIKENNRLMERELIRRALEQTGGNRTNASKILEISHRALLYKIKEYGLAEPN